MPAPRKYPSELRERSIRLVHEAMEDPSLSMNQAVFRIMQQSREQLFEHPLPPADNGYVGNGKLETRSPLNRDELSPMS